MELVPEGHEIDETVPEKVSAAVAIALRPLVVESPVVGKINDFVITAAEEVAGVLRSMFRENLFCAASLFKVRFEPIEDARNFDLFLVGQKPIEIIPASVALPSVLDQDVENLIDFHGRSQ